MKAVNDRITLIINRYLDPWKDPDGICGDRFHNYMSNQLNHKTWRLMHDRLIVCADQLGSNIISPLKADLYEHWT